MALVDTWSATVACDREKCPFVFSIVNCLNEEEAREHIDEVTRRHILLAHGEEETVNITTVEPQAAERQSQVH